MSNVLPEAKVTIIIERLDGSVKKVTVPLASGIGYIVNNAVGRNGLPLEQRFSFGCYALYDIDQNLVADEQRLSRIEYEDSIIVQARDILRDRWMDPETQTVDTTSINIIKGEN